jgi:L-phenylalanine/L-methionine N-acetyltransferase
MRLSAMLRDPAHLTVREASIEDAAELTEFIRRLAAENLDTVTAREPPTLEGQQSFLTSAIEADRAFILVAEDGRTIVGMLDLWAGQKPETRHAGSFGMCVDLEWRNLGVGRRLLNMALNKVGAWDGFCRVELEVAAWNDPAISLYERAGFQTEGRKTKSFNRRGKPEDTLMMALTW